MKISDNEFSVLIKLFDFLIINLLIVAFLEAMGLEPSIVDVFAGLLFSLIFLLCGEYSGFYKLSYDSPKRMITKKIVISIICSFLLMKCAVIQLVHLKGEGTSVLTPFIFWEANLISMFIIFSFRLIVQWFYTKEVYSQKIAILGLTPGGLSVEKGLLDKYGPNFKNNISYYDDRGAERFGYITKSAYSGTVEQLLEVCLKGEVDEVYIALPMVARDRIRSFLHILSDTTVDTFIVPDLYTYNLSHSQLKTVGSVQTFSVFASPFEGMGALIKRMIDLVVGSAITLMILPVLIAVAIGVKLSSPGPVLFKQDRYGLGGKEIKVWKFRSMRVMENSDVVTQATKNDPRVTKFGSFIRRTSLDELPQFINVLQGHMSIVGPRPHAVAHNEEYRKIVANYMIRHKVKPGITGLAQISGYRGETDTVDKMEKRVQYDIRYMQNWTPFYDIKIIFLTIFKGFVSETAY